MYLDITFKSVNFNFPTMAHFTSFLCTFDFWILFYFIFISFYEISSCVCVLNVLFV